MNQVSLGRRGLLGGTIGLMALVAAIAAPAALANSTANGNAIDADLRGMVPAVTLVGQGNVQFETGLGLTKDGADAHLLRAWTTPTIMRFGMPNYEIRVQSDAYSHIRTLGAVNAGMSDLMIGLKGVAPPLLDPRLSVAVLAQAWFPNGASQIKHNGVRPEIQLVGQWQLPSNTAISGVAGVRSDVDVEDARYATGMLGLNLAHGWTPRINTFAELAAREIRTAARGGKNLMWDVGAAWRALPATQLNARVGWGIKENDTDLAWRIGVSTRFRPPDLGAMTHKHDSKEDQPQSASDNDR